MNKLTTTAVVALSFTLGACTQYAQPMCDREAISWDKWGEPEELAPECLPTVIATPVPTVRKDRDSNPRRNTPTSPPNDEPNEPPKDKPEVDTPSDKPDRVKGNNGWGNGDQSAPGNSGSNNNAENDQGGRTQRNHGPANNN